MPGQDKRDAENSQLVCAVCKMHIPKLFRERPVHNPQANRTCYNAYMLREEHQRQREEYTSPEFGVLAYSNKR